MKSPPAGTGDNPRASVPLPTTMPLDFTKLIVKPHSLATAIKEEATISKSLWKEAYRAASSANLDSVIQYLNKHA